MNSTVNSKPKAKYSSRNLSAVFKAPLRSKPLPDHSTNLLQRSNNRLLVLGRTAVAPPAPLNTPSIKRESLTRDVPVSLVPAGANWADVGEKDNESEENPSTCADMMTTTPTVNAWSDNMTNQLQSKRNTENCGRWGDDAVEHDIIQTSIRHQQQKEREFPDLKKAMEDIQIHNQAEDSSVPALKSVSMGSPQPETHRGRATGRWLHFNEEHRSMQENRSSRGNYGVVGAERWSHDRGKGQSWSQDHYFEADENCRDEERYGLYHQHSSDNISLLENDSRSHFSRSDARFGIASVNETNALTSRRMNWRGRLECRDEYLASPTSLEEQEESIFSTQELDLLPHSSLTPKAADVVPTKAMNSRSLWCPIPTAAPCSGSNAWLKDEEPCKPVKAVGDIVESHSNLAISDRAGTVLQPSKRSKMLFDPKTGCMMRVDDKTALSKGHTRERHRRKKRESAEFTKTSKDSGNANSKSLGGNAIGESNKSSAADQADASVIVVNSVQEIGVEKSRCDNRTMSSFSSNIAVNAAENVEESFNENNRRRGFKHLSEISFVQQEVQSPSITKRSRGSLSGTSRATKTCQQPLKNQKNARESSVIDETDSYHSNVSSKERRKSTKGRFKEVEAKVESTSLAQQKQTSNVRAEDEKIQEVKTTVECRRGKNPAHQRLASSREAQVMVTRRINAVRKERNAGQSKGEKVQENVRLSPKPIELVSNPRKSRSDAVSRSKDKKPRLKQSKQAKNLEWKSLPITDDSNKHASEDSKRSPTGSKPTEQVAGEAPIEKPKKDGKICKSETKREQKAQKKSLDPTTGTRSSQIKKSAKDSDVEKTKSRGSTARAKPKQLRQVYVVKTTVTSSVV